MEEKNQFEWLSGEVANLKYLKEKRQALRNNPTPAERELWKYLQNKQLDGYKFRRQFSVGNYILDFYCTAVKLAVELDGAPHFTEEGKSYDKNRDEYLNSQGIRVLRFENNEVLETIENVLNTIKEVMQARKQAPITH
jgi:very-short-patch-repair endonuclease